MSATSYSFGLEEIGIPGREYLREALNSCNDPLKAIEDFQTENGILLPSLRPMLQLLDLHGIKRLDFHNSVLEDLRNKLISKISEVGAIKNVKERENNLKELLVKSFPVIKIKQLRSVVMTVLKHMSYIEDKYLRVLMRDKELYEDCDIAIKRHLWRDNQSLYGDEVSPLFNQYIKEKERMLYDHEKNIGFFDLSPKGRRKGKIVQALAETIGSNIKLYDMTLQFLRTLFLRTRSVHYCTLRAELLMVLHEREVHDITSADPCHKFTWCLDACIREKNVDAKRSRELQGFLDAIPQTAEEHLMGMMGDLCMMLCDPFAINFLASSIMKILNHIVINEQLPRDNSLIHLLLRLLILGISALEMLGSQDFSEPYLDPQIFTRFIPSLMSLITDDQVRAFNVRLPVDQRDNAITIIEHSGPPQDAYQTFIEESPLAMCLGMFYTLQTARAKDRTGLMRVLGILSTSIKGHPFENAFIHCLVSSLIQMKDEFEAEDFCTVVFDEFFSSSLSSENITCHLLRLLWFVYSKLSKTRLDNLLKLTEPLGGGGGGVEETFLIKRHAELVEKVMALQALQSEIEMQDDEKTSIIS